MKTPPSPAAPITGTPNSGILFEEARKRGQRNVEYISDMTEANELEEKTIARFEALVRHGSKSIDILVRKDGREEAFEADWLARLFRTEKI